MRRLTALLPLLLTASLDAQAVKPTAGPMLGHVTDRSARVWLQFPIAGEVAINVFDANTGRGTPPVAGLKADLEGPAPFTVDLPMNNLAPDHTYRIEVAFDGNPIDLPGPPFVIRTAPALGDEATFTIAAGSNLYMNAGGAGGKEPAAPVFSAVTALRPRAFFFLGNAGYLPAKLDQFPQQRRGAFRALCDMHARTRRSPELQELFRTTPTYALFNDRDFGTRDADSSFVFASESLVAFQRFWPNPDWGTPANPGCFTSFTYGDVDFFFLDTRTFRDPDAAAGAKTLLGDPQKEWLKKSLADSRARFKILCAPCPLFTTDPDSWKVLFPQEQAAFTQWLSANKINGLLALAGNRPQGELTRVEPKDTGLQYPLFTLGTSTLNDVPAADRPPATPPSPQMIGQPVAQNTFATLDFGGKREHRFVTLRLREESGKPRLEQILFALQLQGN